MFYVYLAKPDRYFGTRATGERPFFGFKSLEAAEDLARVQRVREGYTVILL